MSSSGRAGRLCFTGKYIDHRLVARPEPDSTFWNDSTGKKRCGGGGGIEEGLFSVTSFVHDPYLTPL